MMGWAGMPMTRRDAMNMNYSFFGMVYGVPVAEASSDCPHEVKQIKKKL